MSFFSLSLLSDDLRSKDERKSLVEREGEREILAKFFLLSFDPDFQRESKLCNSRWV